MSNRWFWGVLVVCCVYLLQVKVCIGAEGCFVHGQLLNRYYNPVDGGEIVFFKAEKGERHLPANSPKPDAVGTISKNGWFMVHLEAGRYFLAVHKKAKKFSLKKSQKDLALPIDEKGNPIAYEIAIGRSNDLGSIIMADIL